PEFFVYVKPLLKAWNGKTLREAAHFKPDAVSGATFSSDAVIKTVNAAAAKLSK
ncbi:MAG: FMN-binding protein, partial [Bacteroidaceae bacterium]|nr:FMN-binding protein [Bacteroidaceae bacterium]